MRTRHTFAAVIAASALALTGGGVAIAAPLTPAQTGPNSQACIDAKSTVLTFNLDGRIVIANSNAKRWDGRATEQRGKADTADKLATDQQAIADANSNATTEAGIKLRDDARKAVTAALAARDAARAELTKALAGRDAERALAATGLRAQLAALVATQDRVCAPGSTPAPTTTPAPPAPTTTPAPPATPRPANDIDCVDVSRAEAQRILNADKSDPNNLDSNDNGTACEEGAPAVIVNNNSGSDNGSYPSKAPQTGGV